MIKFSLFLLLAIMTFSCSVLRKTPRTELTDGFYSRKQGDSRQKVYVDLHENRLDVYPVKIVEGKKTVDTSSVIGNYNKESSIDYKEFTLLRKNSFDLDFLTIPLKYRIAREDVPPQLNTELNGSIYFGLRTDQYKIGYEQNPLGRQEREIKHFGFSLGILTGLGSSVITPTTTNDLTENEYDGLIWTKGIAGIFAINSFTVGISLGIDNLMDENRNIWIYESKPWVGIAIGLNIN